MKYNWEAMNDQQKLNAVQKELKLVTHMATTKDDLLNMVRWLFDNFEAAEAEEVTGINQSLIRLLELIEIYNGQGVLRSEFEAFAGDTDNPVHTIDDLIDTMESEMSYWEE